MITLINTTSTRENRELVLFQLVLKAYPTCHSWFITAHISLGHLEHHWKSFNRQMDKTCKLLQFLSQQPSVPTQLIATLQVELTNSNDIYISYRPTFIAAINLLDMDPSFERKGLTNSLRNSLRNRKLWFTSYPFLTSNSMQHKCNIMVSVPLIYR